MNPGHKGEKQIELGKGQQLHGRNQDFPDGPPVKLSHPMHGVQVWPLGGKLRPHMSHGQNTRT